MSAATLFTCNACGNTGMGVRGEWFRPVPELLAYVAELSKPA
jgi:hypothetical protein